MNSIASETNPFNHVQTIWKNTPEYYLNPWAYYVEFIRILKERNACFLTMSQALAGDYNEKEINIILDHHIDFYPLETEAMARWELENGVISNIYLFNCFKVYDSPQLKLWNLEDLNIDFYQTLERAGFEIGYHQNAVGQVRNSSQGRKYDKNLSKDEIEKAKLIFARDVDNLKKYFNIRTFIPHGAGEANAYLLELPDGYESLTWVYNNAPDERPIKWVNYTDSCGQKTQRLRAPYAQYLLHIDNLHVKAYLAEPGLNHILIHPGRFAKGMPEKLYRDSNAKHNFWEKAINIFKRKRQIISRFEFDFNSKTGNLPVKSTQLIARWEGKEGTKYRLTRWKLRPDFYRIPRLISKYRILSDNMEVLRNHMARNDLCIPFLLLYEKLDTNQKKALQESHRDKSGKNVSVSCPISPDPALHEDQSYIDELFREQFYAYYNTLYSHEPLLHLAEVDLRFDYLHLAHLELNLYRNFSELIHLLQLYKNYSSVRLRVKVNCGNLERWIKLVEAETAKEILEHYDIHYDTKESSATKFNIYIASPKSNPAI